MAALTKVNANLKKTLAQLSVKKNLQLKRWQAKTVPALIAWQGVLKAAKAKLADGDLPNGLPKAASLEV